MNRRKIYIERIPGFLASVYEKATRLVIDSYYSQVADEVVTHLKSGLLLDLGTGPGYCAIEIARKSESIRVDGIDLSLRLIKMAQENARRSGVDDKVNFETGNAARLRFADASYDMVISTGLLHMLKDPIKMLEECYRVLKPGDEAWVFDPAQVTSRMDKKTYMASLNRWEKFVLKMFNIKCKMKPIYYYSRHEVIDMISATRFKEYSIEEKNGVIKGRFKKSKC
jgi:ubiquinone/menaquinone biosynthesis C-methylase UbiE